jgi:hypothetical protein
MDGGQVRAQIEAAARDLGVVPGDTAYPFVQFVVQHQASLEAVLNRAEEQTNQRTDAAIAQLTHQLARAMPQAAPAFTLTPVVPLGETASTLILQPSRGRSR